jgi:hypothetical protein
MDLPDLFTHFSHAALYASMVQDTVATLAANLKPAFHAASQFIQDMRAPFRECSPLSPSEKLYSGLKLVVFPGIFVFTVATLNAEGAITSVLSTGDEIAKLARTGQQMRQASAPTEVQLNLF